MIESIAMARRNAGRVLGTSTAVAVFVAFAHGLNDAYAAFLHPLLPRIMRRLDLSISLAAVLTTSLALASSLIQPALGYVADRYGRRAFVVLGPVFSGVFMSLMPGGAALSSGIVMGLAWATGSVGVLGAGVMGDLWGARTAALVCTPVVLAATALALHPSLRRAAQRAG